MQIDLTTLPKTSLTSLRFPIHKVINCLEVQVHLFEGMSLELRAVEGSAIAVMAFFESGYNVVGLIPKGMMPHLENVVSNASNYCVQVDSIDCSQLTDKMWITIDELPLIQGRPI
ncbi:MAG TPA: hypothetical protein DCX14_01030 [Flavobacteriales bacterium]|nr:hypothetical protein [Flavobacteriales bacterium]